MNISNSFSVFLYSFKLKDKLLHHPDAIWKPSFIEPDKNFYFSHIQDFFIKNNTAAGAIVDPSCCVRYDLVKENLSPAQKEKLTLFHKLFAKSRHIATVGSGKTIAFKLITDRSVLGPSLLYNPLTEIGILSFSCALSESDKTLHQLTDLNYQFREFGKNNDPVFHFPKQEYARGQQQAVTDALRTANPQLAQDDDAYHKWNVCSLINVLLRDITLEHTAALSPNRLQGFTYVQTTEKPEAQALAEASFRLRRMYNNAFIPDPVFLHASSETEQTFEHIHFGASIEGCVVIVQGAKEVLPPFLRDFEHTVKNRYFWSYLLAYYQRLAIIDMNDQLSHLYDEGLPALDKLLEASSKLSRTELRTLFSQVSFFSQHNDFYEFCKRNLRLEELYDAIRGKMEDVSRLLTEQLEMEEKRRDMERKEEQYIREQNLILEKKVQERTRALRKEKQKSDDLLLNILPLEIAEELKQNGAAAARLYDHVTILFTDFVNFTRISEQLSPQELIDELHTCFKAFDEISTKYHLEKIKTIGDAYLAVCGLPTPHERHAQNTVQAAIAIRDFMAARKKRLGDKTFGIRIGVHSGSAIAGIVGVKKFAYDIWGDTVNTAARMESSGEAEKVNISEHTYALVKEEFHCVYRGKIAAKNKGVMKMYFVNGQLTMDN